QEPVAGPLQTALCPFDGSEGGGGGKKETVWGPPPRPPRPQHPPRPVPPPHRRGGRPSWARAVRRGSAPPHSTPPPPPAARAPAARRRRGAPLVADWPVRADFRGVAQRATARYAHVDTRINNAGNPFNRREQSPDGRELTWATNHLAPFLLTELLLPLLVRAPAGRIVNRPRRSTAASSTWTTLKATARTAGWPPPESPSSA